MEKRIFYVLSLFLFACMQNVNAQKVDEINWANYAAFVTDENALTEYKPGSDSELASEPKFVLLYNATRKKFLSNGGDYGMQGVLSNIGNRFYITEQTNTPVYATSNGSYAKGYVIHSNTKNLAEKGLGNCMSINLCEGDPSKGICTGIFMDRGDKFDRTNSSNSMPNWHFELVKTDGKSYYISNIDVVGDEKGKVTVNKYDNKDNTFVAYGTGTNVSLYCGEDDNLIYSSVSGQKDEWYIITEENYRDVIRGLLEYSYVDVSGLVHDGGFNRFNTFAKDWVALKENGTQVGIEEAANLGYYLENYPNKNYVENFAYDTYSEMLNEDITRNNVKELLAYRSHIIGAGRLERKLYQRYHTWDEYISGYDKNGEMEYKSDHREKVYTFLGADGKYNLVVKNGFLTAVPTTSKLYISGANSSLKKSGLIIDNNDWDDPVAVSQVSDGIYRMTLTTGVNLNAWYISFKFFKGPGWSDEFTPANVTLQGLATELLKVNPSIGDINLQDGKHFDEKTNYVFTVTNVTEEGYTLDIQKQKVDGQLNVGSTTELKKDFVYTISKSDGVKADPDFFLDNGDGTYRFMAIDGTYTIGEVNGYLKAEVTKDNDVYVSGYKFKYGNNWSGLYSISKVSDTSYRLTMTTGTDFSATEMNMKFYWSSSWYGYERTAIKFSGLADGLLKIREDEGNVGNLAYADGKSLKDNTTYVFTVTPNIDGGYNLDIQEQLESGFANADNTTATSLAKGRQYKIKKNTENIELDPEFFELAYFVEDTEIVDKTRNNWNNTQPWLFWKDYGKYFSAGIYSNGSYKQTVKDAPEGTYYVRCTAVNTGTNVDFGKFTVNGQTVSILPLQEEDKQRYEDIKKEVIAAAKERLWLTDDYYYQRLDAIVAAKFLEENKEKYTLEIAVKVPEDNGTIDIEFANRNTDAASALANPVFADNFQIFYGKQEYVAYISANNANPKKLDTYAYNRPVELYVRREFQEGAWNSIVLPFDIKEDNVVAAFGEGAKLSMLEGVNPARPTQIKFDYVSVLPAGECGLVWVPENAKKPFQGGTKKLTVLTGPITSNTTTSDMPGLRGPKEVSGPLYNFGSVSRLDNGKDTDDGFVDFTIEGGNVSDNVVTKDYKTAAGTLKYTGYYYKQNAKWEAGSYIVDGGNMYYLTKDWGVKYATMWSLKDPNSTEAKTFEINGVADYTVTEISGIAMDTNKVNDGKIYNINGQYVGATADNLPKGLYIVNGKKFVVK